MISKSGYNYKCLGEINLISNKLHYLFSNKNISDKRFVTKRHSTLSIPVTRKKQFYLRLSSLLMNTVTIRFIT